MKREIEPVSFGDIYLAMFERIASKGTLPKGDTRVMVESVRSLEHGQRTLDLIARHVAAKRELAGALEADWPARKKWLMRLCELALRQPTMRSLITDVFANADKFGLSTYFAAEAVEVLSKRGAEADLLARIVELFRAKRPLGDKGVAAAYFRLMEVLQERKEESMYKSIRSALNRYLSPALAGAATPQTLTSEMRPPAVVPAAVRQQVEAAAAVTAAASS